ncbi:MAG: phospholipid carrier-dependent glycosyltransferase [Candidatus Taylorbacteria bacterium]|nr:phospholipid carrier-dependent glycosyltransferase [Candidatus Taylorbacteria bacterium]
MNTVELKRSFTNIPRTEVWIFVFSLIIKLTASCLLFAQNGADFISGGDASGYLDIGKSIATGEGFSVGGMASAFRTPLYPLFLSIFYFLHIPIALLPTIQIFLLSITAVLIYRIGTSLFSAKTGFIAAILFSIEPLLLVYANIALSESFFTFIFVSSIYFSVKYFSTNSSKKSLALSALLIGATALTRPIGMYFPLLFLFLLFIKNRLDNNNLTAIFKPVIIYFSLFFVIILPWLIRNEIVFGNFKLTNQGAIQIYNERIPIVIASEKHIDYNSASLENQKNFPNLIPNFNSAILSNTFEYNDILTREAVRVLRRGVPALLKFHAIAAVSYFHTTGYDYVLGYFGIKSPASVSNFTNYIFHHQWKSLVKALLQTDLYNIVRILGYLLWFTINIAIIISIILDLKQSKKNLFSIIFMTTIVLYFATFSIGSHTQARYRIPTYPFLFILIGFASTKIVDKLNIKSNRIYKK